MITSTEDKFDVDYDVFSFAGRAALLGGGLYALDKSIKEGVFKKDPKNLGKFNNNYIANLSQMLEKDINKPERKVNDLSKFKNKSYFKESDSLPRPISLSSINDEEVLSLKDLLKGGYKDRSKELINELEALRNEIRVTDSSEEFINLRKQKPGVKSGRMSVQTDKSGKILSVSFDSLAGKQTINVVDQDGMITIRDNKYLTRSQFTNEGQRAGKIFGVDVAHASFLREKYIDLVRGNISTNEVRSKLNKSLTYNGKVYDRISKERIDSNVAKNILNSAQDNVFSPMNHVARSMVMLKEATEGKGIASASNLADGIIRLLGDSIDDVDGLAYTSNPNQLFRANTFYIDKDGNRKSLTDVNVAFLDDKQLENFQRIGKEKYGFNFGDLAKEELIANSKMLGSVGDNSRSIQIRGDYLTDASEFVLERMREATGLSKDDFEAKIREGGFDAFDSTTRDKLRSIGTSDYSKWLKEEQSRTLQKRQALMYANGSSDEFRKGRRELLAQREALIKVKRGRSFNILTKGKAKDIKRNRRDFLLYKQGEELLKAGKLDSEIERIDSLLKEVRKKIDPKVLRSKEYKDAQRLKQQGKLNANDIRDLDNHLLNLKEKINNADVFGLSNDKSQTQSITKKIKNLFFENLHIGKEGNLTFSLLKISKIGQGTKGIDVAGETKAVYKSASDYVSDILIDMHVQEYGSISPEAEAAYRSTHVIAKKEAMKTEIIDRNLQDAIHSIRAKNAANPNEEVTRLLKEFDSSSKADGDYTKLIRDLSKTVGGQYDPEGKYLGGADINKLLGTDHGVAFIKNKLVAFGSVAEDLGAGDLGFVAERHFALMLGMPNFAKSVMGRKSTAGAFKTFRNFSEVDKMMKDSVNAGFISFDNLQDNNSSFYRFMSEVFPSVTEDGVDRLQNLKNRKEVLSRLGKYDNGAAFVSLKGTFNGISKIPIFADEDMMGLIGEQIGFDGDYKKYTEIDRLTKDIIYEAYSSNRDEGRLKTLITNYQEAMKQMSGTLRDKILSGKVKGSMIGQAASGSEALNQYADKLFNKGIKHAAPSVAAVSKKQFIKMFGPDAYKTFKADFADGKASSFWAFAIREPVEGLSGLPVNVVPADVFDGIKDLDERRIALVANRSNSILNMVFGDYDGDQLSLIAATDDLSAEEIKRLATSNDADAVAFRKSQETVTKFKLKGVHSKSLLSNDLAALRLSNFYAKDLEKGFVGIASNTLKGLHEVNRKIHSEMINGKLMPTEKFYRTEKMLHVLAENIIKAKAQSVDDLKNKRAQKVLDAIVGNDEFMNASMTDRIKMFRQFADEVTLGDAAQFADRLRSGEKGEKIISEISESLGGDLNRANDIVNGGWFVDFTGDESMSDIMKVSGLSQRGADEIQDALDNIIAKEAGEAQYRLTQLAEQTQEGIEQSKKMFRGFGGNAMKYAVLPAAVLGVLGTVFGAKSNISSDVEFSDGQRKHDRSGSKPFKLGESVNIKQPTHMKPEVVGQAKTGFQINKYAATHRVNSVRIQDDSRNFDYFDMQDSLRRGY